MVWRTQNILVAAVLSGAVAESGGGATATAEVGEEEWRCGGRPSDGAGKQTGAARERVVYLQ